MRQAKMPPVAVMSQASATHDTTRPPTDAPMNTAVLTPARMRRMTGVSRRSSRVKIANTSTPSASA